MRCSRQTAGYPETYHQPHNNHTNIDLNIVLSLVTHLTIQQARLLHDVSYSDALACDWRSP